MTDWVTTIYFCEDLTLNGTTVKKDTFTQVRWDFGISSIRINGEGKITEVDHTYPLRGDAGKAYEKNILTFTGGMDANMGYLFFNEGQLVNLDFCAGELSAFLINEMSTVRFSSQVGRLETSLSKEEGKSLMDEIDSIRVKLQKGVTDESDFLFAKFWLEYEARPEILVDPFT